MTFDELESLVLQSKDPWVLQRALASLDEAQRGKLSSAAQKLMTQLTRNKPDGAASPQLKALIAKRGDSRWQHMQSRENANAKLALFAVGPLTAVKKRDAFLRMDDRPVMAQIVSDRRPDWIGAYVDHELEQEFSGTLDFPLLRSWIKAGVCPKPTIDGYYRMFAAHLMRTTDYPGRTPAPPISRQLLEDPDLLDDVEGIFRVETIAFNTNSWLVKSSSADFETWPQALTKLSGAGHLDRDRILDLCLEGLSLDIKQNQLAGYHHLYEALKPTNEELLRHQPQYVGLLAHPVAHVAKFGLEMLGKLDKAGELEPGPVLREITEVFARGNKGNALAALRLISRVIKTGPKDTALTAICEALRHPQVEVQAKALEILEANGKALTETHAEQLAQAQAAVGASNRTRLNTLLSTLGPTRDAGPASDEPQKAQAAVSAPYSPILMLGEVSVLADEARIDPITSVDDLIDAVFHAVEVLDSADEVERIVGAISRLAADRPADFSRRIDPLLHRLKGQPTGGKGLIGLRVGIGLVTLELIYTWATGRLHKTPQLASTFFREQNAFAPMTAHLRAVAERVAGREAYAPLSEPTHKGGWVDPMVWVDRLSKQPDLAKVAGGIDLRLSLGRLAPDGREAALERAQSIASHVGRLARFALGGDERPSKSDRAHIVAWIAAARCRGPAEDWSETFATSNLADQTPGVLRPARFQWTSSSEAGEHSGTRWKRGQIEITVDSAPPTHPAPGGRVGKVLGSLANLAPIDWKSLPSAAMAHPIEIHPLYSSDLNATWTAEWLGFVWPQDPSGAYIQAVTKLIWRVDENSSGWEPGYGFFHGLFQKGRPWGEAGHLILAFGLVAKDADVKGVALDALIEGINGRLLDPEMLGEVLRRLCAGGWVKLNRLAENLIKATRVSPLHADVIDQALQRALDGLDFSQPNAGALLELLIETQATSDKPLAPAVRATLEAITGSGRVAKLAKRLL